MTTLVQPLMIVVNIHEDESQHPVECFADLYINFGKGVRDETLEIPTGEALFFARMAKQECEQMTIEVVFGEECEFTDNNLEG